MRPERAAKSGDARAARLHDAARSVRAVATTLQAAALEMGSDVVSSASPGSAIADLRAAQNELARAAQKLAGKNTDSRADLIHQLEALRSNIGSRVEQLTGTCRRPTLKPSEAAAVQRRAGLTDAIRAVDRILARAMQTMANVHRYERRVEAGSTRPRTRP